MKLVYKKTLYLQIWWFTTADTEVSWMLSHCITMFCSNSNVSQECQNRTFTTILLAYRPFNPLSKAESSRYSSTRLYSCPLDTDPTSCTKHTDSCRSMLLYWHIHRHVKTLEKVVTQSKQPLFNAHFLLIKVHSEVKNFKLCCYSCLFNYFLYNSQWINIC